VITIFISFIFFTLGVYLLSGLILSLYYSSPSRLSISTNIFGSFNELFKDLSQPGLTKLFISLIVIFIFINLLGNIPIVDLINLYYFYTATFSIIIWLSLISVISLTQFKSFVAHLLPYGSPFSLAILLPLIELFSQLIRPLTLIIRLRTNLSSGHIIIFIFSYFTLSSFIAVSLIGPFLIILLFLELVISLLQAYIFTSLCYQYITERI
jgi:ATP synthase subunit 6